MHEPHAGELNNEFTCYRKTTNQKIKETNSNANAVFYTNNCLSFKKKKSIMLFKYLLTLFSNDRYAKVKAEASLHPVLWGAKFDIFSDLARFS